MRPADRDTRLLNHRPPRLYMAGARQSIAKPLSKVDSRQHISLPEKLSENIPGRLMIMEPSGGCRLCGGPLPARKPGPGRPRVKCDRCQQLRRPAIVPDWNSALVQTVKAKFPDDRDPFTLLLWQLAALLSGAQAA